MPAQWLSSVLEEIKSCDPSSTLCATRRSAGIPFYIQVPTNVINSDLIFFFMSFLVNTLMYLFFLLQPLLVKNNYLSLYRLLLPLCNQVVTC